MKKEILKNDVLTVRVKDNEALKLIGSAVDVVEEKLDVIEEGASEVLDKVEAVASEVVQVTRNNPYILAGVAVVALAAGGYAGYLFGVKRTTLKYEAVLEEEIAAAKEFYSKLNKAEEYSTPESAVTALVPDEVVAAVRTYQGKPEVTETVSVEIKVPPVTTNRNVFSDAATNPSYFDYALEVANREEQPDKPYVISREEFENSPADQEQINMAYYAGDDVTVDERDTPIDNVDYLLGDDNMTRFGHGSGDAKVVYIRNEAVSTDFEVIRSEGSYAQEVLGHSPEIRHSHRRSRMSWSADE